MYRYDGCGLPNIFLQNGYRTIKSPYGDSIAVEDVEGLHREIGRVIAGKGGRLTGAEFRFLRIEMDMSQKAVGRIFGKSEQAVANWEKGKTKVPQLEDAVIRKLYMEYMQEAGQLKEMLETLVDLDNQIAALEEEMVFCETAQGWSSCSDIAA